MKNSFIPKGKTGEPHRSSWSYPSFPFLSSARLIVALALGSASLSSLAFSQTEEYERAPFSYSASVPQNQITQLQKDIKDGTWKPPIGDSLKFLEAVLKRLEIPQSSQVLVYSKTSHQNDLINPSNPRCVFYNERTYVGWVPGGLIELADIDPLRGAVFYVLDPRSSAEKPTIVRDEGCLSCHASSRTDNYPGVMLRSVIVDSRGHVMVTSSEGNNITHETPISERWGGWYVTGNHGDIRHLGNITGPEGVRRPELDLEKGANLVDLQNFFDTTKYPSKGSDIMSLMVLEHQLGMQQQITSAQYMVTLALLRYQSLQKELGEDSNFGDGLSDTARTIINHQKDKLIDYIFFRTEAPFPTGGIRGDKAFEEDFARRAVTDGKGRSLRDLHHFHRLFKYRCSYMIYTESFLTLPPVLKASVYAAMHDILNGNHKDDSFEYLGEMEQESIKEIIVQTHPEIRKIWDEYEKGADQKKLTALLGGEL